MNAESRRPHEATGSLKSTAADSTSVPEPMDIVGSETLWDALIDCPPGALAWAALGYRVGVLDGAAEERRRIGRAGLEMIGAPQWKATIRRPTFDELKQRRGEA